MCCCIESLWIQSIKNQVWFIFTGSIHKEKIKCSPENMMGKESIRNGGLSVPEHRLKGTVRRKSCSASRDENQCTGWSTSRRKDVEEVRAGRRAGGSDDVGGRRESSSSGGWVCNKLNTLGLF